MMVKRDDNPLKTRFFQTNNSNNYNNLKNGINGNVLSNGNGRDINGKIDSNIIILNKNEKNENADDSVKKSEKITNLVKQFEENIQKIDGNIMNNNIIEEQINK